ncbi:insulin gene enhancer protein ISL-2 isoform X2 [Anolis sagrei]|uniref:insulin gene enhancer protein ISL-2 isoform X2 n=1 Tax=Anolis sagrei TaxID=38937 RepID=UPI00352217A1
MVDILFPFTFLGAMGDPPKKRRAVSRCVGCGGEILDPYILRVAPDLEWHAACLKCHGCSQALDETCTCFVREGKTYCKRDYFRLFGAKCGQCGGGFRSSDLVMRAREKVFHLDCFRCAACGRQLLPGDEFALRDHRLLCREDHQARPTDPHREGDPDTATPPGGEGQDHGEGSPPGSPARGRTHPEPSGLDGDPAGGRKPHPARQRSAGQRGGGPDVPTPLESPQRLRPPERLGPASLPTIGLLFGIRLPGKLLRQRRDLLVFPAPRHPQQHGSQPRGDVKTMAFWPPPASSRLLPMDLCMPLLPA